MHIDLDYLIIKNFLSYGNSETKFEFKNGLTLITASNGSGKSTWLDGLCYNWYGKPYRKIKNDELINRKNKKNLYTETGFTIDKKDKYKIIRTQTPNKLFVYKNDSDKPLESSSTKLLDQEEILKIIGIDYDLFKMIIAIATNYNEPFLSMGLPQKRQTIESIFSIKVFGEMLQKARKKLNAIKTDRTIYQSNIKNLESLVLTLKKQIDESEKTIKEFDTNKENEIQNLNSEKEKLNSELEKLKSDILEVTKVFESIKLDDNDYSKKQIELNSSSKVEETSIKDKKTQIKFLEKGGSCPLCGNEVTDEHKEKELKKLNDSIQKSETKIEKNKKSLTNLNEKINEQRNIKLKYDETSRNIQNLIYRQKTIDSNLKNVENQIQKVNDRTLNLDTSSMKIEYESKIETYKNDSNELMKLNEEYKNYEIVSKLLAEDGIKSYFFKMLIPILNAKINEYLNIFDLPVTINFDETMKDSISIIGTSETNLNYMGFSEGEKKRIDIAILLSFISVTKIISNWNCNILIFDEILDSATDTEGLEKLLSSIKEMTIKENNLCTYVISHREAYQDIYDNILTVKKVNCFSKIEMK